MAKGRRVKPLEPKKVRSFNPPKPKKGPMDKGPMAMSPKIAGALFNVARNMRNERMKRV